MPDTLPTYEIPAALREFAEKSVDQARHAFGIYFDAAHKAVATLEGHPATATFKTHEVARRTLAYTEANIRATLDLAEKLVHARDAVEVSQIHSEHLKNRASVLLGQVLDFNTAFRNSVADLPSQQAEAAAKKANTKGQ